MNSTAGRVNVESIGKGDHRYINAMNSRGVSMFNISRRRFLETGGPLAVLSAMTRTVVAATPSAQADINGLPRVQAGACRPAFRS